MSQDGGKKVRKGGGAFQKIYRLQNSNKEMREDIANYGI
jgi:hypothetical protein